LHLPAALEFELQKVLRVLAGHGARRVILYGSFARGDFKDHSDFDLCVEDISSENYFLVYAECLLATNHPLSLVDIKDVKGYFLDRILTEGKTVYESSGIPERLQFGLENLQKVKSAIEAFQKDSATPEMRHSAWAYA